MRGIEGCYERYLSKYLSVGAIQALQGYNQQWQIWEALIVRSSIYGDNDDASAVDEDGEDERGMHTIVTPIHLTYMLSTYC